MLKALTQKARENRIAFQVVGQTIRRRALRSARKFDPGKRHVFAHVSYVTRAVFKLRIWQTVARGRVTNSNELDAPMKPQQILAVAVLVLATFGAIASTALLPGQLGKQRSVPQVIVGSATVAQTNALFEIARTLPFDVQTSVLATHGFASLDTLEQTLAAQRTELAAAEQARSGDIQRTERGALALLALSVFACFATACGAISLFDAYRRAEASETDSAACSASIVCQ
jgi:hypothetical protein